MLLVQSCSEGERADAGKPGEVWFEELGAERGLAFRHVSGHEREYWMPEIMGGGGALLDLDEDGDLDAYLVQSGRLNGTGSEPNQLFENEGAGRFRDVTAASGAGSRGYGMGVAAGDADQDGDTDLYVTNVGPNILLENRGGLRFAESERGGVAHPGWGTSAVFLDSDRDGDLDLFVANYLDWSFEGELPCLNALSQPDYCSPKNYKTPALDAFYVNGGDGRFTDESGPSGIGAKRGTGLGVAAGDVDGNGWLDVFVANDGMANHLWLNQGGNRFRETALLAGCGVDSSGQEKAGMGVVLSDLDGDRDLDLFVCNLAGESDSLYLNEKGYFVDRTAVSGLGPVSKPFTRFGVGALDFDHDGELDLFESTGRVQSASEPRSADVYSEEDLLFRGLGPVRFAEVARRGGVRAPLVATGRAAVFGDVDGDGAIDVLVVNRDGAAHLLRNAAEPKGHWILLDVRESSGRAALGASAEIVVSGRTLRREVASAYSYLSANDPKVHVGLGGAREVQSVLVRWVDGARESFGPLEADRVHPLRRGQGRPAD